MNRSSRAAARSSDSALAANLTLLRKAIDLYAAEHFNAYPTSALIVLQLTTYTDAAGNVSDTSGGRYLYGPYLNVIPDLPVGAYAGNSDIIGTDQVVSTGKKTKKPKKGVPANSASTVGWLYNPGTGAIGSFTTTEADVAGKLYSDY